MKSSVNALYPFRKELLGCRILIVEDDFIGRSTLLQIFHNHGFTNLETAENGVEGLQKALDFHPDLIVTDIQMPEMDGFELCKQIRANKTLPLSTVPILVQTALSDPGEKARAFLSGASDYISKPVDAWELAARSNVHLERELATRKLMEYIHRISQELEIAKSMQHVLMPSEPLIRSLERQHHLSVCEHFQSCSELGGDFWGLKPLGNDDFAIYAVDFSGHGVNAALNVFRLHALMHSSATEAAAPGEYLTELNSVLAPLLPVGQFATMFYGVVDSRRNTLSYASAAAPAPIVFKAGGQYEIIDSSGTLLGVHAGTQYDTKTIPFNIGDCLLLYSDALIETPNASGHMLTEEEVAGNFAANISPVSCIPAFRSLLDIYDKDYAANLNDDLTLVALSRQCCF